MWHASIHTYLVSENIPFSTNTRLILPMSVFFCKKSAIFGQNSTLLKAIVWELRWRFFSSVFSFDKIKGYYQWKYKFHRLCVRNPASRLLQICRKLEKWEWRYNFLKWRHRQFFLALFCFSCQYHQWFWSYDNFLL